ncbi:hypothetical protein GE09DRAFT_439881 [Coniochaeta sp. 2T2.1]|nr:hypothetical protein GE09DRAFT_439881 [Coniochaeta sp. 2T2.1]
MHTEPSSKTLSLDRSLLLPPPIPQGWNGIFFPAQPNVRTTIRIQIVLLELSKLDYSYGCHLRRCPTAVTNSLLRSKTRAPIARTASSASNCPHRDNKSTARSKQGCTPGQTSSSHNNPNPSRLWLQPRSQAAAESGAGENQPTRLTVFPVPSRTSTSTIPGPCSGCTPPQPSFTACVTTATSLWCSDSGSPWSHPPVVFRTVSVSLPSMGQPSPCRPDHGNLQRERSVFEAEPVRITRRT